MCQFYLAVPKLACARNFGQAVNCLKSCTVGRVGNDQSALKVTQSQSDLFSAFGFNQYGGIESEEGCQSYRLTYADPMPLCYGANLFPLSSVQQSSRRSMWPFGSSAIGALTT